MCPADLDALLDLYASLPETDLYRRFFQARVPPRHVVERTTHAAERGDVALVAEMVDHAAGGPASPTMVAEAAYAVLPDGDGDLGIAVSPRSRGWLGPYLLAVLCEEAAARGVPNLEAEVLLDNARMLALVRRRGYATKGHSMAPAIVHVVFSTTGPVPSWPPAGTHPRIVVEAAGGRWRAESALRMEGFDVLVCPGPRTRWSRCPAVRGLPCPLVHDADLVVDALGAEAAGGPGMAALHRRLHPTTRLFEEHAPGAGGAGGTGGASVLRLAGADGEDGSVVAELTRLLTGGDADQPDSATT